MTDIQIEVQEAEQALDEFTFKDVQKKLAFWTDGELLELSIHLPAVLARRAAFYREMGAKLEAHARKGGV